MIIFRCRLQVSGILSNKCFASSKHQLSGYVFVHFTGKCTVLRFIKQNFAQPFAKLLSFTAFSLLFPSLLFRGVEE